MEQRQYPCNLCEKSYKQLCRLEDHIRAHLNERPYKCNLCSRDFCSRNSLYHHMKINHMIKMEKERNFKCGVCSRVYVRHGSFTNHLNNGFCRFFNTSNPDGTYLKPFKCATCNVSFTTDGALHVHNIRVHRENKRGMRIFSCGVCGHSYRKKGSLRIHVIKKHPMESRDEGCRQAGKLFHCDFCSRIYCSRASLTRHKKVLHAVEKRVRRKRVSGSCPVCGLISLDLAAHLKKHEGRELVKCKFCHLRFNSDADAATHALRKHYTSVEIL